MKFLGIMLLALLFVTTTACNDAEFSKTQESLKATVSNIDQEDSSEDIAEVGDAEDEVTKEDEDKVFEQMEEDLDEDVMVVKEPVEEIIQLDDDEIDTSDLIETYLCEDKGKSKNKKYMICKVPRGNPENAKSKCLPKSALKAHVEALSSNGSVGYMGPCK